MRMRSPDSDGRPPIMSRTGAASPKAWSRQAEKERPAFGGRPASERSGTWGRIPLRNSDYGLPRGVERRLHRRPEHHPHIGVLLALALDETIAGRRPRLHLVIQIVERELALVGLEGEDRMAFLALVLDHRHQQGLPW